MKPSTPLYKLTFPSVNRYLKVKAAYIETNKFKEFPGRSYMSTASNTLTVLSISLTIISGRTYGSNHKF